MRIAKFSLAALFVVLATAILAPVGHAAALPGGRSLAHGYFDDGTNSNHNWHQVLPNGGLNYTSLTNKTNFIDFIVGKLNSGSTQEKTGAAFIINLMLGQSGPGYGRSPSSTAIQDWKDRINDSSVTLKAENYSYGYNSAYSAQMNDDLFYTDSDSRYSLVFYVDGVKKMAIKQDCGNPLDGLPGLPKAKLSRVQGYVDLDTGGHVDSGGTVYAGSAHAKPGAAVFHLDTNPVKTTMKLTGVSSKYEIVGYRWCKWNPSDSTKCSVLQPVTTSGMTGAGTQSASWTDPTALKAGATYSMRWVVKLKPARVQGYVELNTGGAVNSGGTVYAGSANAKPGSAAFYLDTSPGSNTMKITGLSSNYEVVGYKWCTGDPCNTIESTVHAASSFSKSLTANKTYNMRWIVKLKPSILKGSVMTETGSAVAAGTASATPPSNSSTASSFTFSNLTPGSVTMKYVSNSTYDIVGYQWCGTTACSGSPAKSGTASSFSKTLAANKTYYVRWIVSPKPPTIKGNIVYAVDGTNVAAGGTVKAGDATDSDGNASFTLKPSMTATPQSKTMSYASPNAAYKIVGYRWCGTSACPTGKPSATSGTSFSKSLASNTTYYMLWIVEPKPVTVNVYVTDARGTSMSGVTLTNAGQSPVSSPSTSPLKVTVTLTKSPQTKTFKISNIPTGYVSGGFVWCDGNCVPGTNGSGTDSTTDKSLTGGSTYGLRWVLKIIAPSCGGVNFSPEPFDSETTPYTVTASASFLSAAAAKAVFNDSSTRYTLKVGSQGYTNSASPDSKTLNGATITFTYTSSIKLVPGAYTVTYNLSNTVLITGTMNCAPKKSVGYLPYFSVRNGDSIAGIGMQRHGAAATCSTNNAAGFATWNYGDLAGKRYRGGSTNYGAMALSSIQGFPTAYNADSTAGGGSAASFANSGSGVNVTDQYYGGNFGTYQGCVRDYYATMPADAKEFNGNGLPTGSGYWKTDKDFVKTSPSGAPITIEKSEHLVVYVDGDVQITGNIEFAKGSYTSLNQIPSLWIVATGNIYVSKDVTRLDGVYIAQGKQGVADTGVIYTCTGPGNTRSNIKTYVDITNYANCNTNKLNVYGALIAQQLVLNRSFGTLSLYNDTVNGGAAEAIRMTPLTWLAPSGVTSDGTYDAITSLPPVL